MGNVLFLVYIDETNKFLLLLGAHGNRSTIEFSSPRVLGHNGLILRKSLASKFS